MNINPEDDKTIPKAPRLLIIGGGAVVSEYYVPALKKLNYINEATIIDISVDIVRGLKEKFGEINAWRADYRDFLNDCSVKDRFDAAVVALPNWLHEEAVTRCLRLGLHVLCEKPLALSGEACSRLADVADSVNRVLVVGMVRRLIPGVIALQEALKSGLIGPLEAIDIQHGGPYAWLSDSGAFFKRENGGVLADMGIHYLDLVAGLAGPLTPERYYDDCRGGVEANCEFHLRLEGNIPVKIKLSRTSKLRNTAIIKGKAGELILDLDSFGFCYLELRDAHDMEIKISPRKPFLWGDMPYALESCFVEQFFRFALRIQGVRAEYVNARDAAYTSSLVEWAYSHRGAPKPVHLNIAGSDKRPELPPSPVVITGGTGFIGAHLVDRLASFNFDKITVPMRNYRTCSEVARFPVSMPLVDLLDYRQVNAAVKGARYIFHLAYGRDGFGSERSRITIEGTKNIVEAGIAEGAESIVIFSTAYVFGAPRVKTNVDESRPYNPTGGEYGLSKAKMEKWCLKRARSSKNTRIVILNPTCVYGPSGKTYTLLPVQMAKEQQFCWIEGGRGAANYTFVENLIDAALLAANCADAHGERFIINDGCSTWRLFFGPLLDPLAENIPSYSKAQLLSMSQNRSQPKITDIAKIVFTDQRIIAILKGSYLGRAAIGFAEKCAPGILRKAQTIKRNVSSSISEPRQRLPAPPVWLAGLFGTGSPSFSSEKAQRVLKWRTRIDLNKGQEITLDWLKSEGII